MTNERRTLRIGSNHDARRIAQEQYRQSEGVAKLHEPRGLVGPIRIDRSRKVQRVTRDHAERFAFDARERGDRAGSERAAQLEHGVRIGEDLERGPHVVHA